MSDEAQGAQKILILNSDGSIGQLSVDLNGNLLVSSINDLTILVDLIAALQTFVNNGSGNPTPANTSLYDALTWQLQTPISVSQAPPTQNQYYTVLPTTKNIKLLAIQCVVASTAENLQMRVTIDGVVCTASILATAGTYYSFYVLATQYGTLDSSGVLAGFFAPLEARSIKIEIEKTTNNGSGTLTTYVLYQTR